MSKPICKFYNKGLCKYGSSCRFSHSDHSNNQYQDEYPARKNANREYYHANSNDGKHYEHYVPEYHNYEQSDYQPDIVTYHSRKDNYNRSHYNRKNDNYNSENYNSNKNHYDNNYRSNDNYKYSKQKENNVKNYYKEYDNAGNGDGNVNSNYNFDRRNVKDNNANYGENRPLRNYNDQSNYNGNPLQNREKKLKEYEKEIKYFQTQINQLLCSNIWPLTCYQPLSYPIQPVGNLNLIDVSFEEIRCDFYALKNIVADPESVHKYSVEEIMSKARRQKEAIISLDDYIQADLLATFDKIEQSKMQNPSFYNSIQADPNNYWDMSQKYLKKFEMNQSEINKFSFALSEETEQKAPSLKILMQVETYGQVDNEAFTQENFTDFIPIMPPPQKFCL